jgi:hypothetical protein
MNSIHMQFEYIRDRNYKGNEATLVTRNTLKEYNKNNEQYDYIIFSRVVCRNITQLSDYYQKRLIIMTETYPDIKIHLAIQQYMGEKEPYLGIGNTYKTIDGNGEKIPNDMICMPMPLENDKVETNVTMEDIASSSSWYDQMNDDDEFKLHQTLMQNQMDNRKNDEKENKL